MEKPEITDRLTELFREVFNSSTLILDDKLTANDIENWDSLTHFLLITKIEEIFALKFEMKELNRMRNVGDIKDVIHAKF